MDGIIEQEWRKTIKKQLEHCAAHRLSFLKKMYCNGNQDAIPADELTFVLSSTEPSLNA